MNALKCIYKMKITDNKSYSKGIIFINTLFTG
jgi:hypothetical protein